MRDVPQAPLLGEDPAFVAAWTAAIEAFPEEERAIKREIMAMCVDIERKIQSISRTMRDCNVIMARTIGRMVQFEATKGDCS